MWITLSVRPLHIGAGIIAGMMGKSARSIGFEPISFSNTALAHVGAG